MSASSTSNATAASQQHTMFPLPALPLVAGKSQTDLSTLQLPPPQPLRAVLATNPALAQARVVENVFTKDQCEQIMQNDVAYIPIVYRNAYDVYKPWVKGVPVNKQGFTIPNGNIYVGMWNTVYIEGRTK